MKRILFVCKHNIFRSRLAEYFFNKRNKSRGYEATSAGLIKWNEKDLKGDTAYEAEKKVLNSMGINLKIRSKAIDSSTLKNTDILVIVADDVPDIFSNEKSFSGNIIIWKVKDVKKKDKDKEKVAKDTIAFIDKKVSSFIKNLK